MLYINRFATFLRWQWHSAEIGILKEYCLSYPVMGSATDTRQTPPPLNLFAGIAELLRACRLSATLEPEWARRIWGEQESTRKSRLPNASTLLKTCSSGRSAKQLRGNP